MAGPCLAACWCDIESSCCAVGSMGDTRAFASVTAISRFLLMCLACAFPWSGLRVRVPDDLGARGSIHNRRCRGATMSTQDTETVTQLLRGQHERVKSMFSELTQMGAGSR